MISCLSWIMTDEGVGAEGSCFSRSSDLSIPLPQFFSIVLNFRSYVLTKRHFPNWQFSKSVLALALGPLDCSSCNVLQPPPPTSKTACTVSEVAIGTMPLGKYLTSTLLFIMLIIRKNY